MLEKSKKNDIMDNVKALCNESVKRKYFYSKRKAYYGRIKSEKSIKNIPTATNTQWRLQSWYQGQGIYRFVGPSGCGNQLRCVWLGGLEDITEGTASIDGTVVNDVAPKTVISLWSSRTMPFIRTWLSTTTWFWPQAAQVQQGRYWQTVNEAAEILGFEGILAT